MAHRWTRSRPANPRGEITGSDDAWLIIPLDDDIAPEPSGDGGLLLRRSSAEKDSWVVLGPTTACINGEPLHLGIRVLRDRDAMQAGESFEFFGTERAAAVAPFPGSERVVYCPRDKQPIEPGSPAVQCPACRLFYHESADLPCFSCAATCVCGHPTDLDGRLQWTPEGL